MRRLSIEGKGRRGRSRLTGVTCNNEDNDTRECSELKSSSIYGVYCLRNLIVDEYRHGMVEVVLGMAPPTNHGNRIDLSISLLK